MSNVSCSVYYNKIYYYICAARECKADVHFCGISRNCVAKFAIGNWKIVQKKFTYASNHPVSQF